MPRISGLVYLQQLLATLAGSVFFILPTEAARDKAITWLCAHDFDVDVNDCYVAPQYERSEVSDRILVELLNARRPTHVIIGIGGGVQEKLGLYLRDALNYRPAIHCIGAALAFLTGDQKSIPRWADRLYLGWLLRLARDPRRYARRFAVARELPRLIARYGADLPPLIGR